MVEITIMNEPISFKILVSPNIIWIGSTSCGSLLLHSLSQASVNLNCDFLIVFHFFKIVGSEKLFIYYLQTTKNKYLPAL